MMQTVLIGIAAGAATALLSLASAFGPLPALLLAAFTALPILIAAIGWSHWAALIAIVVAGGGLSAMLGAGIAIPFLATVGLPAWFLGYLALLARARPDGNLEWYSSGGLLFWAAIVGAAAVAFAIPYYGWDDPDKQEKLRTALALAFSARDANPGETPVVSTDARNLADFFVSIAPFMSALLDTLVNVMNLWLAAVAVRISGRLRRPWPDLPATRMPNYALALAAASFAGTFMPGTPGLLCGIFSTALLIAYALVGFAVVHQTSRGIAYRGVMLVAAYASLLMFGWTILLATVVGLADGLFDLRGRVAALRGSPRI